LAPTYLLMPCLFYVPSSGLCLSFAGEGNQIASGKLPNLAPLSDIWVLLFLHFTNAWYNGRYPIGMCGSNVGLMLLLDRFPKQRQKKIPKRNLSASTPW